MSNDFVDDVMHCGERKTESAASKNVIDVGHFAAGTWLYNKTQILGMCCYEKYYSVLLNVLDGGKVYTLREVDKLIIEYMKKKGIRE